jgi:putative hydrolase of the HAD superfamily
MIVQTKQSNLILRITALGLLLGSAFVFVKHHTTTAPHKPAAIFDLDGVLFKTSKSGAFKKLGGMSVILYALSGKDPANLQKIAFDILFQLRNEKPNTSPDWPTYCGQPLPSIMYEWQEGTITHDAILGQLTPFIEYLDTQHYFSSKREKKLVSKIIDIMFDPQTRITITKPMKEGMALLKRYKEAGYQTYVLSNMDAASMNLLQAQYPEIFNQFDGIVYSADVREIKPHNDIYTHLLRKYGLDPKLCKFFDNQQENIDAAQKLGIESFLCTPKSMKMFRKQVETPKNA